MTELSESTSSARIVVLASGTGTNCQAIIDACAAGHIDGHVVAVVTNNADAGVIARADAASIACHVVEHKGKDLAVRQAADQRLIRLVQGLQPDLVVLAGWMRILGAEVGAALPIINLHPALPGTFPGLGAIERAYQAWSRGEVTQSGIMVHWVPDAGVDIGPTIITRSVEFEPNDTLDTFAARMQACEHQLLVQGCNLALTELRSP